ncbi:EamA family transporter [Leptolyngbya sp. PCC 6406]|uniref:EamA family transporter n=1 Tax=Leptolyngbya sp. PCC 6406 TaxID=1173264 RepID=UPI0002AB9E9E|nr:EamA family transporter [Leptolyngbya sp. PCC 6406]
MIPIHLLIAVLVAVLWGFNFVAIQVGLGSFPPLLFAALRFVVIAFPAIFFVPRRGIPWRWIVAVGLTMGVFQFGLLYIGMANGMPPGLSSLLVQSQALFTLLLSTVILRDVPRRQQWVGVGIALVGMVAIAFARGGQAQILGLLLVLGSSLSWALGNICLKLAKVGSSFRFWVWMALVPPLPLLTLSALFESGQGDALRHLTLLGAGTILYTGLISSLLCFGFWAYLVQHYSPNRVAPFSLLVPIFGMGFSAWLLGDSLSLMEGAGAVLVFLGLVLAVLGSSARKVP